MTAYYTPSGAPTAQGRGVSSSMRAEFVLIQTAFGTVLSDMAGKGALTGGTWTGTHDFSGATLVKLSASTLYGAMNAGGYVISNAGNAVAAGDLVNLQTAQALLSGGGTPANIPITSLGVGTANDGEILMRSGSAIIGRKLPEVVTTTVTATTHTAVDGTRAILTNVAATAVTAPSPVEGAEFEVIPANGLYTNTVDFGAKTVQGPVGSASGVITLDAGASLRARFNSTLDKWVML